MMPVDEMPKPATAAATAPSLADTTTRPSMRTDTWRARPFRRSSGLEPSSADDGVRIQVGGNLGTTGATPGKPEMQSAPAGRYPADARWRSNRRADRNESDVDAFADQRLPLVVHQQHDPQPRWASRKPLSLGISTWTEKLDEAATRIMPRNSSGSTRCVGPRRRGRRGRFHTRQILRARLGQCERTRTAHEERRADFLFEGCDDA